MFAILITGLIVGCNNSVPPDGTSDTGEIEAETTDESSPYAEPLTGIGSNPGGGMWDPTQNQDGDGDVDADGDADDPGTDTPDPDEPTDSCTAENLLYHVRIRDEAGDDIVSTAPLGQPVYVWGEIENPCDNEVSFKTATRCLIESWRIESDTSEFTGDFPCAGSRTNRTVEPESSIEQAVLPLNDLTIGTFTVHLTFGTDRTNSRTFAVAP